MVESKKKKNLVGSPDIFASQDMIHAKIVLSGLCFSILLGIHAM